MKRSHTYVLLHGGNFDNAGDHLMLMCAIRALRATIPCVRIVSNILGLDTFEDRAALRLFQRIWTNRGWRFANIFGTPVIRRYGRVFGIVPDQMIDAVLDMSGYAYADRWGLDPIRQRLAEYRRWKQRGVPVIMLPQAFGPFEKDESRKTMGALLECVDLAFARDEISYQTLCSLVQSRERGRIHLAPEFTQDYDVPLASCGHDLKRSVVLVPNIQVVRQSNFISWNQYIDFWVRSAAAVRDVGYDPVFVQFSRSADADLVNTVLEKACFSGVIRSNDPCVLKGVVKGASVAICSRYHSLVSALSQCVPAASTAWSHKYTEFLREYGFDWALLSVNAGQEEIRGILDRLIGHRDSLAEQLRRHLERVRSSISAMWQQIGEVLARTAKRCQ